MPDRPETEGPNPTNGDRPTGSATPTREPAPPSMRRRVTGWIVSGAIVLFWGAMMAHLIRNDIWTIGLTGDAVIVSPEEFTQNWRDIDEWMEVSHKDTTLGVIRTQVQQLETNDYVASSRVRFRLPIGILKSELQADALGLFDASLTLGRATLEGRLGAYRLRIEMEVSGDTLYYMVVANGQTSGGQFDLVQPPSIYEAMQTLVSRSRDLEVGKVYTVPVFDPLWNVGDGVAVMRVTARETIAPRPGDEPVETFRIETRFNDMVSVAWVDDEGRTVKQRIGPNLVFARVDPARALSRFPDLAQPVGFPEVDREAIRRAAEESMKRPSDQGALQLLRGVLGNL